MFSGVLLAKEDDGEGDRGSVDTKVVDVLALYGRC